MLILAKKDQKVAANSWFAYPCAKIRYIQVSMAEDDQLAEEGEKTIGQLIAAREKAQSIVTDVKRELGKELEGIDPEKKEVLRRLLLGPKVTNKSAAVLVCDILIPSFLKSRGYEIELLSKTGRQNIAAFVRGLLCSDIEIQEWSMALSKQEKSDFSLYLKACQDVYPEGQSPIDYLILWRSWGHSYEECQRLLRATFPEDEDLIYHLENTVTTANGLALHVRTRNSDSCGDLEVGSGRSASPDSLISVYHPHFNHFIERLVFFRYECGYEDPVVARIITEEYSSDVYFGEDWSIGSGTVSRYLSLYADSEHDKYLRNRSSVIAGARKSATDSSAKGESREYTEQELAAMDEAQTAVDFFQDLVGLIPVGIEDDFTKAYATASARALDSNKGIINKYTLDELIYKYQALAQLDNKNISEIAEYFKAIAIIYFKEKSNNQSNIWIHPNLKRRDFLNRVEQWIKNGAIVLGGTDRLSRQRSYQARQRILVDKEM